MLGSEKSNVAKSNVASFRFYGQLPVQNYFLNISAILDQSELEIAQIEAKDKIKVLYFAIWGHLGSKSKDFQSWANYIPKWSSWSRG